MNKKGQESVGMITSLVMGIAGLVIGVIVALVIVSTLIGSGILPSVSNTVTNESGAFVNITGYTVTGAAASGTPRSFSATAVWVDVSGTAWLLQTGNYSFSSAGVLTNLTEVWNATQFDDANISYTYTTDGMEEGTTKRMSTNFTAGIDEVSSKLPTVLLIAAIVLILGILAVLVAVWQRMNLGRGGL